MRGAVAKAARHALAAAALLLLAALQPTSAYPNGYHYCTNSFTNGAVPQHGTYRTKPTALKLELQKNGVAVTEWSAADGPYTLSISSTSKMKGFIARAVIGTLKDSTIGFNSDPAGSLVPPSGSRYVQQQSNCPGGLTQKDAVDLTSFTGVWTPTAGDVCVSFIAVVTPSDSTNYLVKVELPEAGGPGCVAPSPSPTGTPSPSVTPSFVPLPPGVSPSPSARPLAAGDIIALGSVALTPKASLAWSVAYDPSGNHLAQFTLTTSLAGWVGLAWADATKAMVVTPQLQSVVGSPAGWVQQYALGSKTSVGGNPLVSPATAFTSPTVSRGAGGAGWVYTWSRPIAAVGGDKALSLSSPMPYIFAWSTTQTAFSMHDGWVQGTVNLGVKPAPSPDPCVAAVTCNGHGTCATGGTARCSCNLGYAGSTCSSCATGFGASYSTGSLQCVLGAVGATASPSPGSSPMPAGGSSGVVDGGATTDGSAPTPPPPPGPTAPIVTWAINKPFAQVIADPTFDATLEREVTAALALPSTLKATVTLVQQGPTVNGVVQTLVTVMIVPATAATTVRRALQAFDATQLAAAMQYASTLQGMLTTPSSPLLASGLGALTLTSYTPSVNFAAVQPYTHAVDLDGPNGRFSFLWTLDAATQVLHGRLVSKADDGASWLSFGFSSHPGMVGGDVMVYQPGVVSDVVFGYVLDTTTSEGCRKVWTPLSSAVSLTSVRYAVPGSSGDARPAVAVDFTRPFKPTYANPVEVGTDAYTNVIWAWGGYGSDTLNMHVGDGVARLNLVTGGYTYKPPHPLIILHGIVLAFAWGILSPLSIVLGLCSKAAAAKRKRVADVVGEKVFPDPQLVPQPPAWYRAHRIFKTATIVLTVIGFGLGVFAVNSIEEPHFTAPHHRLGLAVFIIALLQGGAAAAHPLPLPQPSAQGNVPDTGEAPAPPSRFRRALGVLHTLTTYLSQILGYAGALTGITLAGNRYGTSTLGYFAAFAALVGLGLAAILYQGAQKACSQQLTGSSRAIVADAGGVDGSGAGINISPSQRTMFSMRLSMKNPAFQGLSGRRVVQAQT